MTAPLDPRIERILEAGNQAPSGENCQPWQFIVRGNEVELLLLPERDQSPYAWGHRGSYLACGAVLENMRVAASREHMRTDIRVLPENDNPKLVARITFEPAPEVAEDPLARAIAKRSTNRKAYALEPMTPVDREALLQAATSPDVLFKLINSREDVATVGRVGSTNEEIMLANKDLHQFFFSHINWTLEQERKRKVGFYIKTLELPPPAQALFRVSKHWFIMRVLLLMRFNKIVAAQNAATNRAASAMGAFMTTANTPLAFVNAGQCIERVWLTATTRGLALQPLTGILFFRLAILAKEDHFSQKEHRRIMKAYAEAERVFGTQGQNIVFMFRIGKADPPTAQAVRLPLAEVVRVIS